MRYVPDRKGTAMYLNYDRDLKAELHRRALLGASAAVSALAPRRRTGVLQASVDVTDDGPNSGVNLDRMAYSVTFAAPYAVPASFPGQPLRVYLETAIQTMEAGS